MALGMIQMVLPAITKTIDRKESTNEQAKMSYFHKSNSIQSRISRNCAQFCWLWAIFITTGMYTASFILWLLFHKMGGFS